MRVAVVQFSPQLGEIAKNKARAEALLLERLQDDNEVDLIVLPELVLAGYNHTAESIRPFLESQDDGTTRIWAGGIAKKYQCLVTVGYAEKAISCGNSQDRESKTLSTDGSSYVAYNSQLTVDAAGTLRAHYRKTHLYYTDEPWALPSPEAWIARGLPLQISRTSRASFPCSELTCASKASGEVTHDSKDVGSRLASTASDAAQEHDHTTTRTAFGICMDLNPHRFTAPWDAYEFCMAAIRNQVSLVILSMAWLTDLPHEELFGTASLDWRSSPATGQTRNEIFRVPDFKTFEYWLGRLVPLIQQKKTVVVVCSNRCGFEPNGSNGASGSVELNELIQSNGPIEISETYSIPPSRIDRQAKETNASQNAQCPQNEISEETDIVGRAETVSALSPTITPSSGNKLDYVRYAGTSYVAELGNGLIKIWRILGRAEEAVLLVNTDHPPVDISC